MKKNNIFCVVALTVTSLLTAPLLGNEEKRVVESQRLGQEIVVLNLINGLELSPDQMKEILVRAENYQRSKQNFDSERKEGEVAVKSVLEHIRELRRKNEDIPDDLARDFHSRQTEVKKAHLNLKDEAHRYAREIESLLEDHQNYLMQKFVPCIVPPEGESRIGQSRNTGRIVQRLERLRQIPERIYYYRKRDIVRGTLNSMRLHMRRPLEDRERKETAEKILELYDRIRNYDAADFEIRKEELAEQLIGFLPNKEMPGAPLKKIEAFLLSSEAADILRGRLDKK